MPIESVLLAVAIAAGFYMAWSIGANDVANAMGTSVGSGALTVKRAVIIAAILEFFGAVLVGSHVTDTIREGIINPAIFVGAELELAFGMIGALLAAAVWLQIASYFGWPVSTTHSIVGAVLGFGVLYGGLNVANWEKVGSIVASWVISPLMCGAIAYIIFSLLRRLIYGSDDPIGAAKRLTPYLVFSVFFVLTLAMVFKGLKNLKLDLDWTGSLIAATAVGAVAWAVSVPLIRRIKPVPVEERTVVHQPQTVNINIDEALSTLTRAAAEAQGEVKTQLATVLRDLKTISRQAQSGTTVEHGSTEYNTVERIFVYLQILSAAFVAFAHGANDVANAVGPMAAVISILQAGQIILKAPVPLWVLVAGAVGIVVGLATWGWRVMITIGKKITELTPTRGFSAEFAAATTIVLASKLGLPISTTHTLVGGVLGVGLAGGISALNLRVVSNIVISWIVTIPVGAIGAIVFYYVLKMLFS